MEKPEISHIIETEDGIIKFQARKPVTPFGKSAHIILPKKLIGKIVEINLVEEIKKNRGKKSNE